MADRKTTDDLGDLAHRIWLAGLGAFAAAEEEGSRLFSRLVERGEGFETQGKETLSDAKARAEETAGRSREAAEEAWSRVNEAFDARLAEALRRLGIPTQREIENLSSRVEELTRAVERLRTVEAKRPADGE